MTADFGVVLDACVILPMPLADTLFRMAEHPRLYLPWWTDEIMSEVSRNLVRTFHRTEAQARHRENELRKAFPSAWVDESYKILIQCMQNDLKDRHVLAAAVRSGSGVIVTYNKGHFPKAALKPFGIICQSPSEFLTNLYDLDKSIATLKLAEQAEELGISLEDLLKRMRKLVPAFIDFVSGELQIELC